MKIKDVFLAILNSEGTELQYYYNIALLCFIYNRCFTQITLEAALNLEYKSFSWT